MAYSKSLCWFRRDLRLHDHTALAHAIEQSQEVIGVFVFDTTILNSLPAHDRRVAFIWDSVNALQHAFAERGGILHILQGNPQEEIPKLAHQLHINAVFTNRDYEPAAQQRDQHIAHTLSNQGIAFHDFKDQVIFEYHEVLTQQGTPYTVFTPYKRAWLNKFASTSLSSHEAPSHFDTKSPVHETPPSIPSLAELGFAAAASNRMTLPAGSIGAAQQLADFLPRLSRYDTYRDFPAKKGVSYLSVHLRFGTISIRECVRIAYTQAEQGCKGAATWLSELIWREFYMAILAHFPHVVTHAFKPIYDRLIFPNDPSLFKAWKAGQTGYPIVDAAMRQLNQSGYMHNRLRMISASFLVKDLQIDWRWGEAYFAEHLNDFDLSANNGGWQWCASTGCDAQPYFRIFNPITQSEKFDPEGLFIRRYIPELGQCPPHALHAPWKHDYVHTSYTRPIVDHAQARALTLERYNAVKTA